MKMLAKMVYGDGSFSCVINNANYSVQKSHPRYSSLKKHFNESNASQFLAEYDIAESVNNFLSKTSTDTPTGLKFDKQSGSVTYNGNVLNNKVVSSIQQMFRNGFCIDPMLKFLENLMKNPSQRSINELYNFLTIHNLHITEDGCFLAYKSVRDDYKDKYSGTVDNKIGAKLRMTRNGVDDDFRKHCSTGFHVGALAYSGPGGWYNSSGDKVLIVKVNPEDVVSVPDDHSYQKLRCCAYEVVGHYVEPLRKPVYSGKVGDDYSAKNYVENKRQEYDDEDDALTVDDMLVGNAYSFEYHGEDRIGVVNSLHKSYVNMYMVSEDKSAGNNRNFTKEDILDIKSVPYDSEDEETDDNEGYDYGDVW